MPTLSRPYTRKAVEFVLIAAVATAIGLLVVWRLGLWNPAGADDPPPGDPLTLKLDPPDVCETTTGYQVEGIDVGNVDDGPKNDGEVVDTWWEEIAEVDVSWTISGGAPPYTLTLDDETFTAEASGSASVSCALQTGPTSRHEMFGHRRYDGTPVVDSGVKTIAAAVVDANGMRVEATATLDVIIDIDYSDIDVLEGGKTYRVFGTLMTIPKGINMQVGGWISMECDDSDPSPLCGETYWMEIVGTNSVRVAQIRLRPGSNRELGRKVSIRPSLGVVGAEPPSDRLTSEEQEAFTNFANALGRWPSGEREQ